MWIDADQADMQAEELYNELKPIVRRYHPHAAHLAFVEIIARMAFHFSVPGETADDGRTAYLARHITDLTDRLSELANEQQVSDR